MTVSSSSAPPRRCIASGNDFSLGGQRSCVAEIGKAGGFLTTQPEAETYAGRRSMSMVARGHRLGVRIALGGVEQLSGWSVDTATGVITFSAAPGAGVAITAGFEFDVPVRFDTDVLDVTLDLERLGSITSIPLLEIRR